MDKHLIAIDLDGTALNNQSRLSDLTINTLRQISDLGHQVMIATGRPFRSAIDIYNDLEIDGPMINLNGAMMTHPGRPHWRPTYQEELDLEIAFDLIQKQRDLDIELIIAESRENLFSSSPELPEGSFYPKNSPYLRELTREVLRENPIGLSVFTKEQRQEQVAEAIRNLHGKQVSVRTWGGDYPVLEVVRKGINKWTGVDRARQFLDIPVERVITFGDQKNDIEMIANAGVGVAMGNAVDQVKSVATSHTLSNDENGLALFLLRYFEL